MKTKLLILLNVLLVSSVLIFSSCAKTPKASFTYDTTSWLLSSGQVSFTNTSTDATSYTWDFGDGTTSTDKDPIHTFAENKAYTVKLTAKGTKKSADASQSVTVSTAINVALITQISATIPNKNASGNNWDPDGVNYDDYRPDLYYVVKKGTTVLYTQISTSLNSYSSTFYYTLPTNSLLINLADWSSALTFEVWDDDGTTDELIGSTPLTLNTYTTGTNSFPYSVILNTATGQEWSFSIDWTSK